MISQVVLRNTDPRDSPEAAHFEADVGKLGCRKAHQCSEVTTFAALVVDRSSEWNSTATACQVDLVRASNSVAHAANVQARST